MIMQLGICFRKEFTTISNITQAILRIAGIGYNEVYLNGDKVGEYFLDLGASDYTKTVLYTS